MDRFNELNARHDNALDRIGLMDELAPGVAWMAHERAVNVVREKLKDCNQLSDAGREQFVFLEYQRVFLFSFFTHAVPMGEEWLDNAAAIFNDLEVTASLLTDDYVEHRGAVFAA